MFLSSLLLMLFGVLPLAVDHGGRAPRYGYNTGQGLGQISWLSSSDPASILVRLKLLRKNAIWRCPQIWRDYTTYAPLLGWDPSPFVAMYEYGYNYTYQGGIDATPTDPDVGVYYWDTNQVARTMGSCPHPSQTVMLADHVVWTDGMAYWGGSGITNSGLPSVFDVTVEHDNHTRTMATYVDGHTEAVLAYAYAYPDDMTPQSFYRGFVPTYTGSE